MYKIPFSKFSKNELHRAREPYVHTRTIVYFIVFATGSVNVYKLIANVCIPCMFFKAYLKHNE
jgi:hypothetical protein